MVSASSPAADPRPAVRVVKEGQGASGASGESGSKDDGGKQGGGEAQVPPVDEQLDEALDMTFPASDPLAIAAPHKEVAVTPDAAGKRGPGDRPRRAGRDSSGSSERSESSESEESEKSPPPAAKAGPSTVREDGAEDGAGGVAQSQHGKA